MDRPSFVRECVKTSISDDYENFNRIVDDVCLWAGSAGIEADTEEIRVALESLIAEGDAEAYILSAKPSKSERVTYSRDMLAKLWFYVTPKGKLNAKSVLELTRKSGTTR